MSYRLIPHPRTQAVFALLSLADLTLTWLLLRQPGSAAYEANPVAHWWLMQFGWAGLVSFKVASVLVVFAAAALVSRSRPRASGGLLGFGCVVVAAVVVYSASLFPSAFSHGHLDEVELARQAERLSQVIDRANRSQAEYNRLMADLSAALIAGQCSLAEAVDRVATSERAQDPSLQRGLAVLLPDCSPRERLAMVVWKHLVGSRRAAALPDDPVLQRIEQEYTATFGTELPAV